MASRAIILAKRLNAAGDANNGMAALIKRIFGIDPSRLPPLSLALYEEL